MPPTPRCKYLLDYLADAGTFLSTGMGRAPLPHSEIAAWQSNVGIELTSWEASTLRILSAVHVGAAAEAEDPECKPPYVDSAPDAKALHCSAVAAKLDNFLD